MQPYNLFCILVFIVLAKYLNEIKQHQRKHVIYGCHVLSESVHDPAWKRTSKSVVNYISVAFNNNSLGEQKQTKQKTFKNIGKES